MKGAQTRPRTADKPRLSKAGFFFFKGCRSLRLADNSPRRQESFMNDSQRIK
jgi:hypothetical protein